MKTFANLLAKKKTKLFWAPVIYFSKVFSIELYPEMIIDIMRRLYFQMKKWKNFAKTIKLI